MCIDEILEVVIPAIVPPFSALLLYGSCARGDQDPSSDIDILQVTPAHSAPYARGKLNITCYTAGQLTTLARSGSLFVRHLVLEAVPLIDPDNILGTLQAEYVEPRSYQAVFKEVVGALPIVAIAENAFNENPCHYSSTAAYLLRTYVYAKAFDLGSGSFSMRHVANMTGDVRPLKLLRDLRLHKTYACFRRVVDLTFELTQITPFCREESLEAFVVNSYGNCDLAVILGLRTLARGELLTYPSMRST